MAYVGYGSLSGSSIIVSAFAVTASSNAASDVTSIGLPEGVYMVWGNVEWSSLGSVPTTINAWVSSSSATLPDLSIRSTLNIASIGNNTGLNAPMQIISIGSGGGTIYLSSYLSNTSGDGTQCGGLYYNKIG